MDLVINSLIVMLLVLGCIATVVLIRSAWVDMKARKQMDKAVDMYLAMTKLKYHALLDELAKEDDGR